MQSAGLRSRPAGSRIGTGGQETAEEDPTGRKAGEALEAIARAKRRHGLRMTGAQP
jgi:hypothetical protein